jgi:tetratricopeptide (TPR) repeat protein
MGSAGGVISDVSMMAFMLLGFGLCAWSLIGMLLMREISFAEFGIYMGIFLGLVVFGFTVPPPLSTAAFMLAGALAIAFPVMRHVANARGILRMDREDIDKYQRTVRARPELPYPYQKLAEIYFRQQHYKEAAEWYEMLLERQDDPDAKQRLKRCNAMLSHQSQTRKICPDCRGENPVEARYCVSCGSMLPGWWEVVEAFRGRKGEMFLLGSFALTLVVGTVLGALSLVPSMVVSLLFLYAAAALVYYLYKRFTTI